ncbi:hypothetical protein JCM17846_18620 [Iodidimonas nitroreducens]|uniref:Uncharacterized protein n=1 Tax=Iodidimonas nitroreducens TaxID=1236968 RepID=A0A5A7N9Q8_9PROT|nr:glycosyl hydrolase 108 family protein [Iodidimonas nitroreducens]GAK33241.1 putative Peptidoglycan domain protein [alpha proteobacterium Q-1]GER04180.1 hypothetical protein JCM17846_18620 [Iodidimonas nitroreducens]
MSLDEIIDRIIDREGGFVNDPLDHGGATNMGITMRTLAHARGVDAVTESDVRALKREEARAIYQKNYIESPGFDRLPPGLQEPVVDMGVLFGPHRAAKALQAALGLAGYRLAGDGIIGPQTVAAVRDANVHTIKDFLMIERLALHVERIRQKPDQVRFAYGWVKRTLAMGGYGER